MEIGEHQKIKAECIQVMTRLEERQNMILNNHLPHLEKKICEVEKWVKGMFGTVVVAIIVGMLRIFNVL